MKLNRIMGITPGKEYESIATGFHNLDLITGGLRIGQLCTIAARPGMGKTEFAVSLLRNIGVLQKVPTAYLSLELNELEIARRLKASITGSWKTIPYEEKKPHKVTQSLEETQRLKDFIQAMEKHGFHLKSDPDVELISVRNVELEAIQMMKEAPVWIEHDSGVGMNEIVSRMERLHQENQVRVVIVDSLHWMKSPDNYVEQSQALMRLRQAAERLKMTVILTSGLARSVEARGGIKRPQLGDLNGWSQLDAFSSMVMFIYRPEYYLIETFEEGTPSENMADITVAKNSFGHTGNVRMNFYNHAGFREITDEDNDKGTHNDDELSIKAPFNQKVSYPF